MARRQQRGTGLSRERAVAAALELLDAKGLDGLTMRALGKSLRVDPMAVYHYIPGKASLLDAVVEAVWSELELPPKRRSWRSEFRAIGEAVRDLLRSHPNALPVLATRQNLGTAGLDVAERTLEALHRAGLSPSTALDMLSVSFSFLIGHALAEVGGQALDAEPVAPATALAQVNTEDAGRRYPRLLAALDAKVDLDDMDVVWTTGTAALIAGIEALAGR